MTAQFLANSASCWKDGRMSLRFSLSDAAKGFVDAVVKEVQLGTPIAMVAVAGGIWTLKGRAVA